MTRTLLLALLSLFLTFCSAADSKGGSINYDIQSYAALQNGYTLSGTITTDGAIGTLSKSDITAWSYTATNGTTTYKVTSTDAFADSAVQNLTATATMLTLVQNGAENFVTLGTVLNSVFVDELEWGRFGLFDSYNLFSASNAVWDATAANPPGLQLGGNTWIIAIVGSQGVPEPGTLTLALLGGVCLAVVQWTRRRRRVANW